MSALQKTPDVEKRCGVKCIEGSGMKKQGAFPGDKFSSVQKVNKVKEGVVCLQAARKVDCRLRIKVF